MYTFWIESEDGTRIYSPSTYSKETTASMWAAETVASLVGGYVYLPTTTMKWGTEKLNKGE